MEDEEKFFYDHQLNFFAEESPIHGRISVETLPQFRSYSSSEREKEESPQIRAYNPMEQLKNIPEHRHPEWLNYFSNHKSLGGVKHFFSFEEDQHREQFLQNIESDALNDNKGSFEIEKLFSGDHVDTQREIIQNNMTALSKRIEEIHVKTMGNINIGKTTSPAFHEHFENFVMVYSSSSFMDEFQENFKNMINHCRKVKGPGIELIVSLYEFWSRSFKDMINEIWRYSSRYTLNFFKKNEVQEGESSMQGSEIRSESSRTMGKEKRKGWTKEENDILLKYIDSNMIFTQSVLKNLADQFGRSASSISSKIQKLIKSRKGEETQEDSLLQKTIEVLKMHQEGLNRETIIQKLNEHYEMGYGGQWEKSVGQLLSSKKQFLRIRGKHKLINPNLFGNLIENDEEKCKLTFKDKVIRVFLSLPKCEGDLKTLVDQYLVLFGESDCEGEPINEDRRKTIESNISKTLSRYQMFDSSSAKTKYLLNPLFKGSNEGMEVQSYFNL